MQFKNLLTAVPAADEAPPNNKDMEGPVLFPAGGPFPTAAGGLRPAPRPARAPPASLFAAQPAAFFGLPRGREEAQEQDGRPAPPSPDRLLLGEALRLLEHRAPAEAGPGGRGARGRRGKSASRFRGVSKANGGKGAKPWLAAISVKEAEYGKYKKFHIGTFAREEDAARAYDRVSIAKLGRARAKTNFPVAEYRAEWAELEALGVHGAVALEREHVTAERPDLLHKTSRFRGVTKINGSKAKPWHAQIKVTEDGKQRNIHIGTFAREEAAAEAYDRASIAYRGLSSAKTNFDKVRYRAECERLGELGVDGVVALLQGDRDAVERSFPTVVLHDDDDDDDDDFFFFFRGPAQRWSSW